MTDLISALKRTLDDDTVKRQGGRIMERWKSIPDWPLYEISDHGRVRSWATCSRITRKRKVPIYRKTPINSVGYPSVMLSERTPRRIKNFRIHRLVATAFVDGDKTLSVAHLDGTRTNNHYTNLIWATNKENEAHKAFHGTKPQGERHVCAKLCDRAVKAVVKLIDSGMSVGDVAELFEISHSTVGDYITGRSRATVTLGRLK